VAKVLILEDNDELAATMSECFHAEGWSTLAIGSLRAFRENMELSQHLPRKGPSRLPPVWDIALIDIYLPDGAGFDAIQMMSKWHPNTRILAFSGMMSQEERIQALEKGADDVLAKPIYLAELVSRIRALLRRATPVQSQVEFQDFGEFIFSATDGSLRLNSNAHHEVRMTPIECQLFNVLLKANGETLSRHDLLRLVWNQKDAVETRTVDVYISRVRKMLFELGGELASNALQSIRGEGYRFVAHGAASQNAIQEIKPVPDSSET
jgi:two-component system, OmpR family, phosphate regulon response regulator PhoB